MDQGEEPRVGKEVCQAPTGYNQTVMFVLSWSGVMEYWSSSLRPPGQVLTHLTMRTVVLQQRRARHAALRRLIGSVSVP